MVNVEFLGPIQKSPAKFEVTNLGELKKILSKDVELTKWLKTCSVAINDEIVCSLETPLKDGDRVTLLPPVCGG
ncbi:MAG: MoaD/ThiS family protein [Campylobacter sp.]|nr:MoaD/ThiS family protein [Campylobacter sp.]